MYRFEEWNVDVLALSSSREHIFQYMPDYRVFGEGVRRQMEDGIGEGRGVDDVVFTGPNAQCEDPGLDVISVRSSV